LILHLFQRKILGFFAYPSIVNVGHNTGYHDIFDDEKANCFKQFLAHELANYYFGTYRKFNSELGDMFSEYFSQYVSLKLTEQINGEKVYLDKIKKKINSLQ